MKIKSLRTNQEYEAEVYKKQTPGGCDVIIRHTFLQSLYDGLEEKLFKPVRRAFETGSPVAVSYEFSDEKDGIFSVGEVTWYEHNEAMSTRNTVLLKNPEQYAVNRCFDKWFIRYMRFIVEGYGKVYSDQEISLKGAILLTSRNLQDAVQQTRPVAFTQQQPPHGPQPSHGTQPSHQQSQQPAVMQQTHSPQQMNRQIPYVQQPAAAVPVASSAPMPVSAQPPIPTQTNMPVPEGVTPEPLIRGGSMGNEPAEEGFVQKTSGSPVSPLIDMEPDDDDEYLPFPESPQPITPPKAAADSKCQPHVIRVNFDFGSGNTAVSTEYGTLMYSPVYHSWISGSGISPAEVRDLGKLYSDASSMVGTPLDQFGGVPSIQ